MPDNPVAPPHALDMPDAATAVYDFILAFALPPIAPERIIRGFENRYSLPAENDDYILYTLAEQTRHGTNVTHFTPPADDSQEGVLSKSKLVEDLVHIDLHGDADIAAQRAAVLEIASRDALGVDFFKPYGISVLHADPIADKSFFNAEKRFVRRLRLSIHLTRTVTLSAHAQYFERATMSRVENVDAHHPPRRE